MGQHIQRKHPSILLPFQIHPPTNVTRRHNHHLRLRKPIYRASRSPRVSFLPFPSLLFPFPPPTSYSSLITLLIPPSYTSTKGAIVAFTRALSNQQIGNGIRVNAVCPGPIWTPLIPATMNEKAQKEFTSPMGRPGQPSECATCFVFLASADSSFISGQSLHPNGGVQVGS